MSSSQFNPLLWQNVNLDDPRQIREFMRQLIPYLAWLQQRLIVLLNAPPVTGGGGGDMLKSVYDTNNNGIADSCDSLPYGRLTGVPTTFAPSAHAPSHVTGGSDIVPTFTRTAVGLAPASGGSTGTTNYLREDGSWAAPPGAGDMTKAVYDTNANSIVDAAESVPWTGVTGKPSTFTPAAHASTHLSSGSDPIAAATATASGLVPTPPNNTTTFLRGDATFAAVPGGGDMLKSTYDTNNNGVADTCDSLPYASLTGVPSSFTPSAHASTHRDTGSDPIGYYEWTYPGGAT